MTLPPSLSSVLVQRRCYPFNDMKTTLNLIRHGETSCLSSIAIVLLRNHLWVSLLSKVLAVPRKKDDIVVVTYCVRFQHQCHGNILL